MSVQNNDFVCPHCRGHLKPGEKIVFSVKSRDGRSGLILLSPHLGDYNIEKHYTLKFSQGEHLELYCPVCHSSLSTPDEHINLAKILMIDNDGLEWEIVFSKSLARNVLTLLMGKRFSLMARMHPNILTTGEKNQIINGVIYNCW